MGLFKKIILLNIIIVAIISCNTDEKEARKNLQIQKGVQDKELNRLKDFYSAVELTKNDLNSYYSFELENKFLGKTAISAGKILDILKVNINLYVIKISIEKDYSQQYYGELKCSKELVDKILKKRNEELLKLDTMIDEYAMKHFLLDDLEYTFIFKPTHIKKGLYIYNSIEDFNIIGENLEDAELDDYTISMKVNSDSYIVLGDCIDLAISSNIIN